MVVNINCKADLSCTFTYSYKIYTTHTVPSHRILISIKAYWHVCVCSTCMQTTKVKIQRMPSPNLSVVIHVPCVLVYMYVI